jgi:hypothetical protein
MDEWKFDFKDIIFFKKIQSHIEKLQEYLMSCLLGSEKVKIGFVEQNF